MTGPFRRAWIGLRRRSRDMLEETQSDVKTNTPIKIGLAAVGVVLLAVVILGMYWSGEPELFDVHEVSRQRAAEYNHEVVVGSTMTATFIHVGDTLLHKPGGFITNDIMPPGVWLDNIPNWEYGVLIQMRDLSKAMREAFSRSQSQSSEDTALARAETHLNFDNDSWALPPTESEYADSVDYLRDYLRRLGDEDNSNAQFYARADNLRYWLSTVETRLGNISKRLGDSVGKQRLNTALSNDPAAQQSTPAPAESIDKTPWTEIDDVFYEARGTTWALLHFLKAAETDFANVLDNKNARVSLQQIIRELEATQDPVLSPMILNGGGFGFLANHSLVMASYISRANAALINLRELLAQG